MDLSKLIKELIDIFKIKNIVLFCFIGSAMLLFAPNAFLEKISLVEFKNKFSFVIGIVFLSTLIIFVMYIIIMPLSDKFVNWSIKSKVKKILIDMDNKNEIEVIKSLYNSADNTKVLFVNRGYVQHLARLNLICPVSSTNAVNILDPQIPYFMQPVVFWAIKESNFLIDKFSYK